MSRDVPEVPGAPGPLPPRPTTTPYAAATGAAGRAPWPRRTAEELGLVRPRDPGVPPRPPVELRLEGAVPDVVLRVLPGVLVLACAPLVHGGAVVWTLTAAAAALVVVRPSLPVAPVVAVMVGLWLLAGDDLLAGVRSAGSSPGAVASADAGAGAPWRLAVTVLVVHLLLRAAALAAHLPWRGWVEAAVLGVVGRSVLAGQLFAQGLLLMALWLRSDLGGALLGRPWLRLAAVVAAVAVTALVVPRGWLARRR